MTEPRTAAGRLLWALRWDGDDPGSIREAILAIEAEAGKLDPERLRQQNHDAAAARDRELAELRSRVALYENAVIRAKELVRGSPVDWTHDPPSQEPDGWWKYTSQQNRDILIAAVAEAGKLDVAVLRQAILCAAGMDPDMPHRFVDGMAGAVADCYEALR